MANSAITGLVGGGATDITNHNKDFFAHDLIKPVRGKYQPSTSNLRSIDLLSLDTDLVGFKSSFHDGNYIYLPVCYGSSPSSSVGKIVRVNPKWEESQSLTNFASVINLSGVNSSYKNFSGGFSDGKYAYLIPYKYGKLVRLDLALWSTGGNPVAVDLFAYNPIFDSFKSSAFDGRYIYLCPSQTTASPPVGVSLAVRVDTQNFTSGGISTLDLLTVDGSLTNMGGVICDDDSVYYIPYKNSKMVRIRRNNFTVAGSTALDLNNKGFSGVCSDGRFLYCIPYEGNSPGIGTFSGKIVRVDKKDYTEDGITSIDLTSDSVKGFDGGCISDDLRYMYLFASVLIDPNYNGETTTYGSTLVIVDLLNFTSGNVVTCDLIGNGVKFKGFRNPLILGDYLFLTPSLYSNIKLGSGVLPKIRIKF